jgi:predicted metal-dependent hydrolase
MKELIAQHPEIGRIRFVASPAARYFRISVKPFDDVRVTVPGGCSAQDAATFVEQKKGWILKARLRMAAREKGYTLFTPETVFHTRFHRVRLYPWKSEQFRAQLAKDGLQIFYPQMADLSAEETQGKIRDYINRLLRREAGEFLPRRTAYFASLHGFSYTGVTVKNLRSRWGSCSPENHINLNIQLMRLPEHLADYVILHELAHTVHKNHGQHFWQCLDECAGGKAKALASEMKRYSTVFY